MTHEPWVTKSSAARILRISRRTIQRYCQLYAQFGESITDSRGRLKTGELWDRITSIKNLERRGFPLGAKRQTKLLTVKPNKKTFGRSYVQRLEIIKQEIASMTDGQQVLLLVGWLQGNYLPMFSPDVRQKAGELLRSKRDNLT